MITIKEKILKTQKEGTEADPFSKKEFNFLLDSPAENLTPLEIRLIATVAALGAALQRIS